MVRTTQAWVVRDEAAARALADHLVSRSRQVPVAVVTVSADAEAPYVDVEELLADVGDLVEVHVLSSGGVSYAFADHMPPDCQVYGGAARAYPVGTEWITRPSRAPLHLAYDAAQGARVLPLLSADLTSMAHAVGLVLPTTSAARPATVVSGEVKGFTASRAVVRLDSGTPVVVAEELLVPGVPVERLLVQGQRVTGPVASGHLDLRASLRSAAEALADVGPRTLLTARVEDVTTGSVSLALHPDLSVDVDQTEVTTNELDELTDLFTVGDVVTVRVVATEPTWRLRLWDVDDDEPVAPAPSLLPGGPPWLDPTAVTVTPPAPLPDATPTAIPALPDRVADPSPTPEQVTEPATGSVAEQAEAPARRPGPSPFSVFGRHDPAPAPPRRASGVPEQREAPATPRPPVEPTAPRVSPAVLDRRRGGDPGAPAVPAAPAPPATPAATRPVGLPRPDPQVALDDLRRLVAEQRDELGALRAERRQLVEHNRQLADRSDALAAQLRDIKTRRRSQGKQPRRASTPPVDEPCFLDAEQQLRHDVLVTWARHVGPHDKAQWPLRDYAVAPEFLTTLQRLEGVPRAKVLDVVVDVVTGRIREMAAARQLHQLREGAAGSPYRRGPRGETCWRVALQVNSPSARRLHYMTDGTLVTLLEVGVHDAHLP